MATLRILVPDQTINYIQNPSMRYDTTGWNASGSVISRTIDYSRFGIGALKIVTSGSANREGTYYRVNALSNISEPITVSAYLRGTGKVRIRLIDNPIGKEWASKPITLRLDQWKRINVSGYSTGTNDMRLYVETYGDSPQTVTFYVDGAQMERKAYPTTYCDGDQDGCRWSGMLHGSSSTRSKYSRDGGRWITFAGPDLENQDLYMTVISGLGVTPIRNVTNPFATLPGSFFQSVKIDDRVVILNFHAKKQESGDCDSNTLQALHLLRKQLFDVIKPDKVGGSKEFLLEYSDGDIPIYLRARYEAGMDGEWDIRNNFYNSFAVRLLCTSPILFEDDQDVFEVDFQGAIILNNAAARIDGEWSSLNHGFNGEIYDFDIGIHGEIIACGTFTQVNYNASAISPMASANRVAYWDGEKWQPYGTGANGTINDIAVAPNGYVYVTGDFTSIGGVAATRVAYWDGSAWNAMSSGLNAEGHTISIAPNGNVYVGGEFTTAGGTTVNYIARWNGVAWVTMGEDTGLNNYVYSIAISQDGNTLYAGGTFTDANGNPGDSLTRVAQYNLLTGIFTSMGNGFAGTVWDVIISPANVIFACGAFNASGSETINYISQWNGSAWISLGAGLNSTCYSMAIDSSGNLVAVGEFTQAGSVQVNKIALWNGSTWVNLDIDVGVGLPTVVIYAVQFTVEDDLFIGGVHFSDSTNSSLYSGINLFTNRGTTEVSPSLYILGPGTLRWLENQSSNRRLYFNLAILDEEEVFIDFAHAEIKSTIRGDLKFSVLQGSDFRSFTLLPQENKIAAFMENDVEAKIRMSCIPNHWSVDSTADGEDL